MKNRLLSLSTSLVLLSLVACGDNANDDTTEEDPLTICERVTDCSGHGTCITVDTVITCDCDEGYEVDGLDCVLPEDSGFELQIDAGSFTLGLNEARNFDVDGGSNGVIWGTFTGTGQPVCFVVDGDADFKMTVGRATKWNEPDIEGSDTGSFDDYECSQNSTAHEPDFCWLRTQQDISYVIQAYRFGYPETVSRATIAVVDGPCPAEVDEAVFTYDEEVSGSPVFENHQVAAITLNEGFANLATESFDAEGTDVLSGFSATFTSPGGPVCFAMDADIDGKITVAKKSDLDDNPFPDSANVGAVPSAQVECYDDGSGSEPDFCGLADTTAGTEYIIFGESLSNYAPKMKASLVAISGPCPLSIDEAVFVY
ncbi:hypothetical protein KAI87_04385, partial [Myxococcota bacterium]|nr:hypothetical protein [Myxococcota bacterium]